MTALTTLETLCILNAVTTKTLTLWLIPLRTRWHGPGGHWRRCSSLQGGSLLPPRAWPLPPMAAPSGASNCIF
ncbi:hypothetical protein [Limnohabitans sp. T6-5]|uniref:hypothetical protein n=1 Tax=Limnohabitans sp. T6-5 TaxID=1100724 RepID=UPI001E3E27C2|nr:hypothetical protein [Limnohabitans sp. T6-5]